ncbi:unnamed protein product [Alopecurus aequalis]
MHEAAAAATSAVLDGDDLLGEILLRLAFPTSLIRAALVCKRWYRLASAPAFLRHFRDLHPPSLLGFYVTTDKDPPRFVPMSQPPELAAVVRRASFDLDTMGMDSARLDYCWNGLVLITLVWKNHGAPASYKRRVHCPLYPTRNLAFLPPLPEISIHDGFTCHDLSTVAKGGGDGLSYFCLAIWCKEQQSVFDVYVLEGNIWVIHSSVAIESPLMDLLLPNSLIVDDRIYNLARVSGTSGVNSGLLLMEKDEVLYLFDIKRKTAKKVFEATKQDRRVYDVSPFMMVWPPKFPVMKEGCDPKE